MRLRPRARAARRAARTLEIVGERWTWLIVRDAFHGLKRFDEFRASLGIARNILSDRLGRFVEEGILAKEPYQERPRRYEYRLTEKGEDLFTALNAIREWGDRYVSEAPMRLLRRRSDGAAVVAALVPEGAPALARDEIELVPGPGFPRAAGD